MNYVMEMSTDADIINTTVNVAWNPITQRYTWHQVSATNLGIPAPATIIVIAHGNNNEIGNAGLGVDIDAEYFLVLVQQNMAPGPSPDAVYISTCGRGIAEFSAAVRIAAENNQIWQNTRIYGHCDPVSGPVPPPSDIRWVEIF